MTWKRENSRVYGHGQSFNCSNQVTAADLCGILNNYDKIAETAKRTEKQLDKIQRSVIQMQMDLSILTNDMNTLKEALK